ncbi:methyl-accepting chemotaxis protein [Sulfolobus acidocaldarius]|uniref:methyl-accepting chemotaxis protein n=1 Tax=Sulfolobus acidocaldarius TaxID=2285 RepID=UPI000780594E|nr:methyl-accepting chemotaxis protein [Sulfolobus acidocaldarius]
MASESDDMVKKLLEDPKFISTLASKIYDRLKDEVVIKRLEENTEAIRNLQQGIMGLEEAVRQQGGSIKSLQETVKQHSEAIRGLQEAVKQQGEILREHSEAIKSLQETVKQHSEAGLQEAVKQQGEILREHSEAIKSLQETVKQHSEAIRGLQEAVKQQGEILREHSEAIKSLQETVKQHSEAIKGLQEAVKQLSNDIKEVSKLTIKLSTEIGSFTNRAGKGLEKTIMMVYKEALELHGIDPNKVKHGNIVDTLGIIDKGRIFEVDFYETNDYVYVFEIKNFADEGALEQMLVRKKLVPQLFNKPVKLFLVANYVDKKVKEELEKEGVTIISSMVVE